MPADQEGSRISRNALWHGGRDALSLPAWVLGFSILGIGSLARDAGFPAGAAVLSTVVMWAGPAQAIFFASIAAGTSLPVFGFALALLVVCTAATYIGYFLLGALPIALAAGLLFLTPIFFTVSLVAGAQSLSDWAAMILGAVLAPGLQLLLGQDLDLLAA